VNTIICTTCNTEIEVDKALEGQIEAKVLAAERHKHEAELAKLREEAEATSKKEREESAGRIRKQLEGEKELLKQQAQDELELAKRKIEMEAVSSQRKVAAEQELLVVSLREDAASEKEASKQLREQLSELMKNLTAEKRARENAELEAAKRLAASEEKIREEVGRQADEKQRLNLAAKEKTITDLQKALDEAQRKAAQGSQQLQGEIMELDLEEALAGAFRDDDVAPVPKGVNGADIAHTVKSPRGVTCGVMLWEIKRTKNWVDGWIPKLKEDVRSAKASVAIIVTEVMPKQITEDMGQLNGVWICKPSLAIVLGALLRKSLLDVGLQKALAENRGDKADALYNFVTSHEFIQQIESMVETYSEMTTQVTKERVAYEKLWAQREKQARKLLMGTANIIGSMQGHIGQSSMPRIKGLELDSADELAQAQLGL
jgi:hypothetical protein